MPEYLQCRYCPAILPKEERDDHEWYEHSAEGKAIQARARSVEQPPLASSIPQDVDTREHIDEANS